MLAGIASSSPQIPAGTGGTVNEALIAAIHDSVSPVTERRLHPRHATTFRVVVRWADVSGREFEAEGEVKDISVGGLYVRLSEAVELGAQVTAELFITPGPVADFAFAGEVTRAEALIDLRHGVSVRFDWPA
jgi:hypothetical protein